MTDIPAGWHDDPENTMQNRYWDGLQWSEHRAPKAPSPGTVGTDDPFDPVARAFPLLKKSWLVLLLLGIAMVGALAAAAVSVFVALDQAIEPGLFDIADRVFSADWNPDFDASDRAFEDSITWTWSASSIVLLAAAIVGYGVSLLAGSISIMHLATVQAGTPKT
jgi:hypothetical protein